MSTLATRPDASEYAPYYQRYIALVPDGDVLATLERQGAEAAALLRGIPAAREEHRYADGKWSVREVVGHMIDVEHVFAFRALWFARGDATPLPGFEQDDWAKATNAGARPLGELVDELEAVRRASVLLFRGLDQEALLRTGTANQVRFTVRAFPWIMAGHELHHLNVLRERYLISS